MLTRTRLVKPLIKYAGNRKKLSRLVFVKPEVTSLNLIEKHEQFNLSKYCKKLQIIKKLPDMFIFFSSKVLTRGQLFRIFNIVLMIR